MQVVNERKEKGKTEIYSLWSVVSLSIRSFTLSPRLFIPMPKDTHDFLKCPCNEIVLRVLQLADENMLCESGNAIYLRMKRELDEIQWVWCFFRGFRKLTYSYARTGFTTSEYKLKTHVHEKSLQSLAFDIRKMASNWDFEPTSCQKKNTCKHIQGATQLHRRCG